MDCSPPGSSVHGIFQARTLEWIAIYFSRGSAWPGEQIQVTHLAGRFFTTEPPRKPSIILGCHEITLSSNLWSLPCSLLYSSLLYIAVLWDFIIDHLASYPTHSPLSVPTKPIASSSIYLSVAELQTHFLATSIWVHHGHHQIFLCIHALCSLLHWITICAFHPLDADKSKRTPSSKSMVTKCCGDLVITSILVTQLCFCLGSELVFFLLDYYIIFLPQLLASNPFFSSFFFVIAAWVIFWKHKSEFVRSPLQTLPDGLKHKV